MPPPCAIETCKRKSRALCHCCNKDLCPDHLKEHDESINAQVNPLVDELNTAADQLSKVNLNEIIVNGRQKLNKWRDECHTLIDQFYQAKCQELPQRCVEKVTKQQNQIDKMRAKMNDLTCEQEATYQDIPLLQATVNDIKRDVNQFEEKGIIVDTRPLIISKDLVYIEEWSSNEVDLSTLPAPFQTITCSSNSVAGNNQFSLFYQPPNLSLFDKHLTLVKQSPWESDGIWNMCWSSTLNRFIITTSKNGVFLVNENLTSIDPIEIIEKKKWLSCTCSDTTLYLTTTEIGSNVFEFNLLSSFHLIKQWSPPKSWESKEIIHSIVYNNETLALIISQNSNNKVRIELRSSTTLDKLWSLPLDITYIPKGNIYRLCLLRCDEWLVMDHTTSRLLHISKDGKLKKTHNYPSKPYNALLFGSNILAIEATNGVNFHRV